MKKMLDQIQSMWTAIPRKAKVRIGIALAVVVILQLYFVRELIAAELLFVLVFAFLLALAGVSYVAGTIGERALILIEAGARAGAGPMRRGYNMLEEISRKPFRHPRSESAQ